MTVEQQVEELRQIVNDLSAICSHYAASQDDPEIRDLAEDVRSRYNVLDQRLGPEGGSQ